MCTGTPVPLLLICTMILAVCGANDTNTTTPTQSALLDDIFKGYDKKLPPKFANKGSDRQVVVVTNVYINKMFSLSEANMEYSMSIFLRERWQDERLAYNNTLLNLTRLELDSSLFNNVWVPDMYILNEKQSSFHTVTVPNKLIHLYPDGTVQYSMRITGRFSCDMFLQKYPFDSQTCSLKLESYGHSTETMKFVWSENALTVAAGQTFPQFSLKTHETYTCEQSYYGIVYPCIGVDFNLSRNYGYYIIQIYIPSLLIVILSWVNFWLDPTSVPARISLGLLTVLTMTTQSSGARADLPRVSYVKAIDVWMAVCLTFVFLGLVEFAVVNVLTRAEKKPKQEKKQSTHRGSSGDTNSQDTNGKMGNTLPVDISQVSVKMKKTSIPCFKNLADLERARMVDKVSRWIFPGAFLIFNIVYWLFYFLVL